MVVQSEAGWCGKRSCAPCQAGGLPRAWGSGSAPPAPYSHPRESLWSWVNSRDEAPRRRGAGWPWGSLPGRAAAESGGDAAAPGSTRKRAERPSPSARTARNRPPPPGCPGHQAQEQRSPPSSLGEKLILQTVNSKPQSQPPGHGSAGAPFREQALSKHPYLPNNATVGLETPLCPG